MDAQGKTTGGRSPRIKPMTMFSSSLPAGHLHGGGKALAAKRLLHACFLVLFFLCTASSCVANTASVKDLYMVGESRYQELQKDSEKQKLRSAWESTARAFEKAHAADPKDAWASASLFRAADTYLTLSKISG